MKNFDVKYWGTSVSPKPAKFQPIRNEGNGSDFEKILCRIESAGIDIAPTYEDWLRLGFAIASEFSHTGLMYYQRLSSYYPNYSAETTEKQYTKCCNSKNAGITIKTFYQLAKNAGININTKKL